MSEQEKIIRSNFGWNFNVPLSEPMLAVNHVTVLGEIAAQLCRANDLKEMELRGVQPASRKDRHAPRHTHH